MIQFDDDPDHNWIQEYFFKDFLSLRDKAIFIPP